MEVRDIQFSKNLKRIRKSRGYFSAKEFSNALMDAGLFYAYSTIRSWESGNRSPNIYTLAELCGFLQVTADELLFG